MPPPIEPRYFITIVNSGLLPRIQDSLDTYVTDLENEGYTIFRPGSVLPSVWGTAEELKNFLRDEYYNRNLEGCLFVGNLPVARYSEGWHDYPTDLFFMDLDGVWEDLNGDGHYDSHTGDTDAEIYVGRLMAADLSYAGNTEVELLQNYFRKNHLYRTGHLPLPRRALYYEDASPASSSDFLGVAYNSYLTENNIYTTSQDDYLKRLSSGQGYEWLHIGAHSNPAGHSFQNGMNDYGFLGGRTNFDDIMRADPRVLFYSVSGCSAGDYTYFYGDYLAGGYIFSNSYGLAAFGITTSSGFTPTNSLAVLNSGGNFGQALMSEILIGAFTKRELVLLGDPTLTLPEGPTPSTSTIPVVSITPPVEEIIPATSSFEIIGTAKRGTSPSSDFDFFTLEVRSGPDFREEIERSNFEKDTEHLTFWDTSGLIGKYFVRLTAYDANGDYDADDFSIHFDPYLKQGWPVNMAETNYSFPKVVDIDGNGENEVIAYSRNGRMHVWDTSGNLRPGWPQAVSSHCFSYPYACIPGTSPVIADIDKDGQMEILYSSAYGIYVWDKDGNPLPGWPVDSLGGEASSLSVGDINQDGELEIVANGNKIFNGSGGLIIDASSLVVPPGEPTTSALGDIDDDGYLEIVSSYNGSGTYVFNKDGLLYNHGYGEPRASGMNCFLPPVIGDIDDDGNMEIITAASNGSGGEIFVWDKYGNIRPGWPYHIDESDFCDSNFSMTLTKLNVNELGIVMSIGGEVRVWNSRGQNIADIVRPNNATSSPLSADFNDDGTYDLFWTAENTSLYWSDPELQPEGFPDYLSDFETRNISAPALANTQRGENISLAVVSGQGKVYYWELPWSYMVENMYWPMFQHDIHHTGNYHADVTAPEIIHSPVSSANVATDIHVSAQITDNIEVRMAKIYFKNSTLPAYEFVQMTNIDVDTWEGDIPASAVIIDGIQYYLVAHDTSINPTTNPFGVPESAYNITVYDDSPPIINHTPVTVVREGEDIPISAQILDNSGEPISATLYFKLGGLDVWQFISMTNTDDTYSAIVPGFYVTLLGLEYYIKAEDDSDNAATSPVNAPDDLYFVEVTEEVEESDADDDVVDADIPEDSPHDYDGGIDADPSDDIPEDFPSEEENNPRPHGGCGCSIIG